MLSKLEMMVEFMRKHGLFELAVDGCVLKLGPARPIGQSDVKTEMKPMQFRHSHAMPLTNNFIPAILGDSVIGTASRA